MLQKIISYLKGYLYIRVTGYSPERFINACSHRNIDIWGLRPSGTSYEMYISVKGFRKLKPVIKKTRTKVTILKRFGLPFFLHRYRKRKLFFVGAVSSLLLIYLFTCFIWNIDITGNRLYTDETLLEFLEGKNVENGMAKRKVDCDRIVKDIRKEYDDIIWVSVSIQGTKLIVQIKENEDSIQVNDSTDEEKAYDIVAESECVITDMIVRKGLAMVKAGDSVKKGDILVSGYIPVKNDAGEITGYQYQKADAQITGKMQIQYKDTVSTQYEIKKDLGIKKEEYYIVLGNRRFAFGGIKNTYETFEEISGEYHVRLTEHFYLPIYWGQRTVRPYEIIQKNYTEKELQQLLTDRFSYYYKDLKKKGVEILQNDVKIYREYQNAVAMGTLTIQQLVGTLEPSDPAELIQENEQSGEVIEGNDGNSH